MQQRLPHCEIAVKDLAALYFRQEGFRRYEDEQDDEFQLPPEKKPKIDIDDREESKFLLEQLKKKEAQFFRHQPAEPQLQCVTATTQFEGGYPLKKCKGFGMSQFMDLQSARGTFARIGWSARGLFVNSLQPENNGILIRSLRRSGILQEDYVTDMLEHNIRCSQIIQRNHSISAKVRHHEMEGQQVAPRVKPSNDHAQLIDSFCATAAQSNRTDEERVWKLCRALFPGNNEGRWRWDRLENVCSWLREEVTLLPKANVTGRDPIMRGTVSTPESSERKRDGRDRRMFANLQGALRGTGAAPLPGSSRAPRRSKVEEPTESLDDLDSIITQISDLSVRPDRSAAQIKRNIASSSYLSKMDEEEWDKLPDSLLQTALSNGEGEFAAGIFVTLMEYDNFCDSIASRLGNICAAYIMEGNDGTDNIPTFLGTILCMHWPRNMSKAIDTVNPVLYTTVSIVKGWLIVLQEDNTAEIIQNLPDLPTESDEENDGTEKSDEENVPEREDPVIVNRCAQAVTSLCESTQRSLWMKWPELCDEIYNAIKPAITHNTRITGNVKAGLLHTLISLHAWTKTGAVTTKSTYTQTV